MTIDRPKVSFARATQPPAPTFRIDGNRVHVSLPEKSITLVGHRLDVTCVRATRDGGVLVTGSQDRTIRIWDATSARELHCLRGHQLAVLDIALSPANLLLASASSDQSIRVWDLARGMEIACLVGQMPISRVLFTPDGEHLVSGEWCGRIRIWNLRNRSLVAAFPGHRFPESISDCGQFIQLGDGHRINFGGQRCGRWRSPQVPVRSA